MSSPAVVPGIATAVRAGPWSNGLGIVVPRHLQEGSPALGKNLGTIRPPFVHPRPDSEACTRGNRVGSRYAGGAEGALMPCAFTMGPHSPPGAHFTLLRVPRLRGGSGEGAGEQEVCRNERGSRFEPFLPQHRLGPVRRTGRLTTRTRGTEPLALLFPVSSRTESQGREGAKNPCDERACTATAPMAADCFEIVCALGSTCGGR